MQRPDRHAHLHFYNQLNSSVDSFEIVDGQKVWDATIQILDVLSSNNIDLLLLSVYDFEGIVPSKTLSISTLLGILTLTFLFSVFFLLRSVM